MVSYANGFVPASALAPLDGQPGCSLRADAAAAWNAGRAEVKRRTGIVLSVRGWNRTYAQQVTFYLQRHVPWRAGLRKCCYWEGRGWYAFTGTAHAAPPGTSNHGWGLAVDVNDYGGVGNFSHPRRVATFPILAQYGWTDTEGRGSIREPWHLVWNPSSAYAVNNPIGGGSAAIPTVPGRPAPLEEEDDMTPDQDARLARIEAALSVPGQPYMYPAAIVGQLTNVLDRLINIADDVRAVRGAQQVPGQPFDWAPATHNAIAALIGEVAGMRAALGAVATGTGLTPEQITKAAQQGAEKALKGITITVDTKD